MAIGKYVLHLFAVILYFVRCDGVVFSTQEETELDSYMDAWMDCNQIPGAGLSVVRGKEVYNKGYGFRDTTNKKGFDEDTVACGGSTGKAFTAVLLAILLTEQNAQGKKLDWNSKIKNLTGDLKFPDKWRTSEITLLDLLTHRTGMASIDFLLMAGYPDNFTDRKTLAQRVKYLYGAAPFREEFIYNNLMYMQLGYIASVLGGASYEELISDRIFRKLNMTSATFLGQIHSTENFAKPYVIVNETLNESDEYIYRVNMISPAGGICASPRDYSKWLQFLLRNGSTDNGERLVEEALWKQMWKGRQYIGSLFEDKFSLYKPFPVTMSTSWYATAWFGSNYRGHEVMFHTGSYFAYSAMTVVLRKANSAYMITINAASSTLPLSYLLSDILLNETRWQNTSGACPQKSAPKDGVVFRRVYTELPDDESSLYTGIYGHRLYGNIKIDYESGYLQTKFGSFMNVTLKYVEYLKSFDVVFHDETLQKELGGILPPMVKFSDKRGDIYHNVSILVFSLQETYYFHREESFEEKETETNTASSKTKVSFFLYLVFVTIFAMLHCRLIGN